MLHFRDEFGEGKQSVLHRQSGRYSNLGEGAIDQIFQSHQASIQNGSGSTGHPHVSRLDRGERERCGMDEVAQLVGEKTQPLIPRSGLTNGRHGVSLITEFRYGVGYGIVQAPVERSKLVYLDHRIALECQVGYCLAEIAVVVNDLLDRVAMV